MLELLEPPAYCEPLFDLSMSCLEDEAAAVLCYEEFECPVALLLLLFAPFA